MANVINEGPLGVSGGFDNKWPLLEGTSERTEEELEDDFETQDQDARFPGSDFGATRTVPVRGGGRASGEGGEAAANLEKLEKRWLDLMQSRRLFDGEGMSRAQIEKAEADFDGTRREIERQIQVAKSEGFRRLAASTAYMADRERHPGDSVR